MPLYEIIIITKPGPSKISMNLLQEVCKTVLTKHPSVTIRDVQNLGDRIMGKVLKKDRIEYPIGRYLQLLIDGPPSVYSTVSYCTKDIFRHEIFRSHMHRVNDLDYALNQYFRAAKSIDPFTDTKDYEYAQKVMSMKEKVDKLD
jgi:ribosomal protein S6